MKRIIIMVLSFSIINFNAYSLNEEWQFNNLFFQLVKPGNITFQDFQYNIIENIHFTETRVYDVNSEIKKASINMMAENDTTRTFECNYLDMGNIISLQINTDDNKKINIILNVIKYSNGNIWYSYSISSDIQYGRIRGISENDIEYANYIGIIRRIR
jgi:hypothetical protein